VFPINREKDCIQVLRVARFRAPPHLMSRLLPALQRSWADNFVRHDHFTPEHQLFNTVQLRQKRNYIHMQGLMISARNRWRLSGLIVSASCTQRGSHLGLELCKDDI
jgi:hypothetical protein